jgi:ubiquitin carboxyl-terminal hydrolase MINDY-1/2
MINENFETSLDGRIPLNLSTTGDHEGFVSDNQFQTPRTEAAERRDADQMNGIYKLKEIYFSNRYLKILCQNTNGPCPLISICNALLLSGQMHIHSDYSEITLHSLIQLLANYIVEKITTSTSSSSSPSAIPSDLDLHNQQRLTEVISLLPSLQYGLDINIHFDSVTHFEYTRELDCFDASGVSLYHGWVLDSQDDVTFSVIGSRSYNQVINLCVEYQSLRELLNQPHSTSAAPVLTAEQHKLLHDGEIAQTFLTETASQFTYMGLLSLYDTVKEGHLFPSSPLLTLLSLSPCSNPPSPRIALYFLSK